MTFLTISTLRNNVSKNNTGCICHFFLPRLAKKLPIFFQHPVNFLKNNFPQNWKQDNVLKPFQDLIINFYPIICEIFAIEGTTMALHKRKFVEAKIAQVYL